MASRHTYTTEIEFGGDVPTACFEITLSYTFDAGRSAWGGSRGEPPINPPEGPTIEDLAVTHIDGKPRPWGQMNMTDAEVEGLILHHIEGELDDDLIERAINDTIDERERAAEARAESRSESWS